MPQQDALIPPMVHYLNTVRCCALPAPAVGKQAHEIGNQQDQCPSEISPFNGGATVEPVRSWLASWYWSSYRQALRRCLYRLIDVRKRPSKSTIIFVGSFQVMCVNGYTVASNIEAPRELKRGGGPPYGALRAPPFPFGDP